MAAFSGVVCLEQLLNQLLNSDQQLPKEELVSLRGKISFLKSYLEKIFPAPKKYRGVANELATHIREVIFEAQDIIESFIFFIQNHPPESPETSKSQSLSLQEIIAAIDRIIEEAEVRDYCIAKGVYFPQPVDESPTLKSSSFGQSTKIVGQEKYKTLIEKKLIGKKLLYRTDSLLVIPISGIPGIGKTTLAKSIYEDDKIMSNFPYKAWITVSQDANAQDILEKILHSLESRGQKAGDKKYEGDEAKLRVELHQALSNNKYLVVIDDLWDAKIWERIKRALPNNENSSRILVTTRILKVADSFGSIESLEMKPLSDVDSWKLLRNNTFVDDKECPVELEYLGRRIAENCKGLPLSLIVIGGLLKQGRKEIEYWTSVEEDTKRDTYDAKSYAGILSLSYDYLPCKLKACFLYMGAFPQGIDIPVSKLIMFWVAEGFLTIPPSPRPKPQLQPELLGFLARPELEPELPRSLEGTAHQSLQDLIDRNLVVIRKYGSNGLIKACGMHSSLRDLAEKESAREMFFHIRKTHPQKLEQCTNIQRRVFVHNNILMCLDDVYNSTKLITDARSLLYLGPHYHHPMPFNLTFDLLRVLDAFSVFFIRFPHEILKLIHLRYLSFTYNGKLPSRLSLLHQLQVLIVKRHPKFICVGTPFLPGQIWNMKELRHLLITETDLPLLSSTEPGSVLLENLQTLSNVNAASCTQEVLGNMPNLKKLVMWVEAPGKVGLYLNKLHHLEVFKLTVLDPIRGKGIEFQPRLFFPDTMIKLCLSGTGLPWEDMEVVAALPNLQVLKLKEFAFHGDEWCPTYVFEQLKFLLIEYLNLKNWETESSIFPCLEQLILRHCYELEELPLYIEEREKLRLIEVVGCSREAVAWAEEVKTNVEEFGIKRLKVEIYTS